jgi:hypothetical protein
VCKKLLLSFLALYAAYFISGIALIYFGLIERFYFLPPLSIKGPDRSTFAADGPWLFTSPRGTVRRQIVPRATALAVEVDTLPPTAAPRLTCFVTETGTSFSFPLHAFPATQPAQYPAPSKMLVVSDIEGNFKGLQQLLTGTGVTNAHDQWQFGTGHLVFVGDMFDRGLQVTECLWLLYKLEQEAEQAGGKVHFLLGNHELMNLTGNYRYVRRKYRRNADSLHVAYAQWYGPTTELGRWLRTKNVIERIGSTLFVHGGISPQVLAQHLSLDQLNHLTQQGIDVADRQALQGVAQLISQSDISPDWYRGIALAEAPAQHVQQVLRTYGAKTLVIGHTPSKQIHTLYQQQVIAIDIPHQDHLEQGFMQALWWENGTFCVIDNQQQKKPLP